MDYKRAFQCAKDGTCPEKNDSSGCPLWWEYAAQSGNIVKGCAFSQSVMFPLLVSISHGAECAAASADKAATASCEAHIAAERGNNSAMAALSLTLGLATGTISPLPTIENHHDEKIQRRLGPVG